MKKVLVLLVVLCFAGAASAAAIEDWETWTVTDVVSSAAGWSSLELEGTSRSGLIIESAGINGSNSAGLPTGSDTTGVGASTAIEASLLGGASHTVSAMVDVSNGSKNLAYLVVGDSSLSTGANTNCLAVIGKSASYAGMGMQTLVNGSRTMDQNFTTTSDPALSGPYPDTLGYYEVKIDMTLDVSGNVTAASASYRDVDDVTGAGGSWNLIGNYTGITPFAITHVGLLSRCNDATDATAGNGPDFGNLAGVIPEPATLAVLALGGLLSLLGRKR